MALIRNPSNFTVSCDLCGYTVDELALEASIDAKLWSREMTKISNGRCHQHLDKAAKALAGFAEQRPKLHPQDIVDTINEYVSHVGRPPQYVILNPADYERLVCAPAGYRAHVNGIPLRIDYVCAVGECYCE